MISTLRFCAETKRRLRGRFWFGLVATLLVLGESELLGGEAARLTVLGATASTDDGNVPANTLDGSLATRWSAQGDGQWIQFDLGNTQDVGTAKIAWHNGTQRQAIFDLQTSGDGSNWVTVFSGRSSGTTADFEAYAVSV